ncbi:Hypothetical predicted protein [Mytilus galloprovincialis]|uniref:Uncharacterized protein n=1 Tax=Mytilus galloprovincialis TaxID=29158 RepID=A0A8B6GWZ6_MYTGA|nr:Hypothetical predicted protein [Mytilus galloprovincialis]
MLTSGRLGFGNIQQPLWQSGDARHRREPVQQEVGEEEDRQVRAVSMKQQGQYMKWEMARPREISWHEISRCGEWSRSLGHTEEEETKIEKGQKFINFIKRGGESSRNTYSKVIGNCSGATANDWGMQADVGGKTTFPRQILTTTLQPIIVLWSRISRHVILVELTVPWKTRLEEDNERKLAKYQELVTDRSKRRIGGHGIFQWRKDVKALFLKRFGEHWGPLN